MGFTQCPRCASNFSDKRDQCPGCGAHIPRRVVPAAIPAVTTSNLSPCMDCGQMISVRAESCPSCGAPTKFAILKRQGVGRGRQDKRVAGALAILLGGLGAHKFYQGKPVQGMVYLIFCWTTIPAMVGVVEGIILLLGGDDM